MEYNSGTLNLPRFSQKFVSTLPADKESANFRRQVYESGYSFVQPAKVPAPVLIGISESLANQLGFTEQHIASKTFVDLLSGNHHYEDLSPYAMCYGGHQFGQWAGQLGDGRAINLGELFLSQQQHVTLQLKGAGATPYSRSADGKAVLRSSIREFLCSEAMFHLGVPTTRALSLCLTGEQIPRDMFYSGDVKLEPGAVVCRVSKSFLRFGSFQLPSSRNDLKLLKQLADYSIEQDFPELLTQYELGNSEIYLQWFTQICNLTCDLMVHWQRVGFVHGVMNTDNMSIIGETIDYGPYGWLEEFDYNWTPNTSDSQHKRYRFGQQAQISQWNLYQLANAIFPLVDNGDALSEILTNYGKHYQQAWLNMMCDKLGIQYSTEPEIATLVDALVELLHARPTDMTLFFRRLADFSSQQITQNMAEVEAFFTDCFYGKAPESSHYQQQLSVWLDEYQQQLIKQAIDDISRKTAMNRVNPKYVLRNYLAQQVIEAAEKGDYSLLQTVQTVLTKPYDEQPNYEHFSKKRPQWADNKAGCSMLSCSS